MKYKILNQYFKENYNTKIRKIPLVLPVTCPNRDGTKSDQGCYFCNNESFSPFLKSSQSLSVRNQIENYLTGRDRINTRYIAYFQAYSNTYGDADFLFELYEQACEFDEILIISLGTRPDCLSDFFLKRLDELSKKIKIWLEIGLQSADDHILKRINRGHSSQDFITCCRKVNQLVPEVRISTHLIFGLPGETRETILRASEIVNSLKISGVKIHPLAIIKNTVFEQQYQQGKIDLISFDEYIERLALFISKINKNVIIERMSEDSKEYLIAPDWVNQKQQIKLKLDQRLRSEKSD